MENKTVKKSTMPQLHALVEYMEANPDFARGRVVFGRSKMSVEEQWNALAKNINSLGPPIRSVSEWKKSWADLKSRTKKKIAENKRSFSETGGGLFRNNPLTELEEVVDRTLFLSKAAAPSGNVFGCSVKKSSIAPEPVDEWFIALKDTPPRSSKAVAVVTPSRQTETSSKQEPSTQQQIDFVQLPQELSIENQNDLCPPQKRRQVDLIEEPFMTSSSKKRKTVADEQLSLIHRQLKVSEQSAALAKDQLEVTKTLVEVTKTLAAAAQRMADAAESQSKTSAKIAETLQEQTKTSAKIAEMLELLAHNLK